jgi:hypothetical protein
MRAKTGIVIVGAAIASIALWIWFGAAQTRLEAETQRAALVARRQGLAAEARRLEALIAATEQAQLTTAAGIPPPVTNLPVNPAPVQVGPRRAPSTADRTATDPNLRLLEPRYRRAIFNLTYGEFFSGHGLSEDQIDRFIAIKMKRADLRVELANVSRTQDAEGRALVTTLQREADADHDLAIEQLLGPETNRALDDYEHTLGARTGLVSAFAGPAALAGLPLTAAQGDRLLQAALAAGFSPAMTGGAGPGPKRIVDIALLDAQAGEILTPEQFQLFLRTSQVRKSEEAGAALARAQQLDAQRTQTAEGK